MMRRPTRAVHARPPVKPPKSHLDSHPIRSLADLKGGSDGSTTFEKPTPRVARRKPAKVLTTAERAAFLASRPDLMSKA